ncbi:PfkB family carbohydrate kinase, partial [Nocardioides aquiterrae]
MARPLVVVGDALLDADLCGRAGRLAPDAPVPVLDNLQEHQRPGGAALAAALAARDGADVVLVAAVGDDEAGTALRRLVADAGVELVALPLHGETPVKRRVRVAGQSLLRLDSGGGTPGAPALGALDVLGDASAVLVSDYGRGTTALPAVRDALARTPHVVWDPHPRGADPVPGVRLATPNREEAALLAGRRRGASPRSGLGAVD